MRIFTLLVLIMFLFSFQAHCFAKNSFNEKVGNKEASRWTLAEWLAQKERVKMMDVWLALHSSDNPYEFFIGGASSSYRLSSDLFDTPESERLNQGELGAFATIVGLRGQYFSSTEDDYGWKASFVLRILGTAEQGTHWNLFYGIRNQKLLFNDVIEEFQNNFIGADFNLYLTSKFGMNFMYEKLLPVKTKNEISKEGDVYSAKVFIDFYFIEVFGRWFQENIELSSDFLRIKSKREGFGLGLLFYF